ncbi:amidase family protein, partial [Pseudomonas sp. GW460-13]|uniref:amidase family protein n=1 Tax=Pseudomonas sp. GW460-13 TaxID=2070590 RepID=UPI000CCB30D0
DLLICPVMPTVAYPHDHRGDGALDPITVSESRSMIVNGLPRPYLDNLQWPSLATVAELPATAVPTGRFVDGMPMGVQLIGPYLEDRTPLQFA